MGKKNVAGLLVETLARAGVRNIYGVSGDSLNGITDSIRTRSDLRWVHVRHEETAAFAAGAEAHLTGRLAVCAGSCGPGNLHLINGLYDCHRSRVPVLAIASRSRRSRRREGVAAAPPGSITPPRAPARRVARASGRARRAC